MSYLQNKSEILNDAAKLLHDKTYYPAVAHSAYYCCYQLLKHIWLYSLRKTDSDFTQELIQHKTQTGDKNIGSHEFLINQITIYIKNSNKKDCRKHSFDFNNNIVQLKKLRRIADYEDSLFDSSKSSSALSLSTDIIPILKKY